MGGRGFYGVYIPLSIFTDLVGDPIEVLFWLIGDILGLERMSSGGVMFGRDRSSEGMLRLADSGSNTELLFDSATLLGVSGLI